MLGPRKPGPELSHGESCWREPQVERREASIPIARDGAAPSARCGWLAPPGAPLPSKTGRRRGRPPRRRNNRGGEALAAPAFPIRRTVLVQSHPTNYLVE